MSFSAVMDDDDDDDTFALIATATLAVALSYG